MDKRNAGLVRFYHHETQLHQRNAGDVFRYEERSGGMRESGAIWSGSVEDPLTAVQRVDFHHELCNDRATALSMELSEEAKFRLYDDLRKEGLKLAALVHTHPSDWVGLSEVDRENQLCSRVGFWSLVVPRYGRKPWVLEELGIHIQTDGGWYELQSEEVTSMVSVEGFTWRATNIAS